MPLTISLTELRSHEELAQPRLDDDVQIEICLPNGRRLTIPATLGLRLPGCLLRAKKVACFCAAVDIRSG